MFTYTDLKKFIEKNNIRYELNPIVKKYDSIDIIGGVIMHVEKEMTIGYYLGMNNIAGRKGKSEYQWVWFRMYADDDEKLTDDAVAFFEQRHSSFNGHTYTGIREEMAAEDTINRRM